MLNHVTFILSPARDHGCLLLFVCVQFIGEDSHHQFHLVNQDSIRHFLPIDLLGN